MAQGASDAFYQNQSQAVAATLFEHTCMLDIDCQPSTCRNTGIVCTIGKDLKFFFRMKYALLISCYNYRKFASSVEVWGLCYFVLC